MSPREAPPPRERAEPRDEPRRESTQGSQGSQAPLDLPPPPAAKPFVVWSSGPADAPTDRRDD
jgi:hypothetical protein